MHFRLLLSMIALLTCSSCETQRIEYHTRPAWHYSMTKRMANEVVRNDGTIVKYVPIGGSTSVAVQEYLDTIVLQETDETTGDTTLRAVLPMHVLTQTLVCLRDRTWELLYDQILSSGAQEYFGSRENGKDEFVAFFENNRNDLAKSMQKMIQGKPFGDVMVREEGRTIHLSFSPRMLGNFTFRKITFYREGEYLKLHSIE
jgi:hypothetical protein